MWYRRTVAALPSLVPWLGFLVLVVLSSIGSVATAQQPRYFDGRPPLQGLGQPDLRPDLRPDWHPAMVHERPSWVQPPGSPDVPIQQSPAEQPAIKERFGLADRISAMARGRVQLEGGYSFIQDKYNGVRVRQHVTPDMLLRVGLTDRFEIRIGWPGYVSTNYEGSGQPPSFKDTLDPNVGFMWDLVDQNGCVPQMAVMAAVPITLEGNSFAMNSLQPLSQVLYSWYLTERLATGGSTGVALFRISGDNFTQLQQTIHLDYVLTDRIGTFLSWQWLADHGSIDDGSQHVLDTGLAFLLTERLEVVGQVGVGLNQRAPDILGGIRFAVRY